MEKNNNKKLRCTIVAALEGTVFILDYMFVHQKKNITKTEKILLSHYTVIVGICFVCRPPLSDPAEGWEIISKPFVIII